MRRLLAWLGGVLGGIALWRYFLRRSEAGAAPAATPPVSAADPRAEALRAKLDEVREAGPVPGLTAEREPATAGDVVDPEQRRRSVHEHGRAALEEMRGGDRDETGS